MGAESETEKTGAWRYALAEMRNRKIQTAIDLSGLDAIEETEEEFRIGCMVTLRQLEQHVGLYIYTDGAMKEDLRHMVGIQFRNLATVGGSIYGRYGFSDVLTMFLAMDSYVELYQGESCHWKNLRQQSGTGIFWCGSL